MRSILYYLSLLFVATASILEVYLLGWVRTSEESFYVFTGLLAFIIISQFYIVLNSKLNSDQGLGTEKLLDQEESNLNQSKKTEVSYVVLALVTLGLAALFILGSVLLFSLMKSLSIRNNNILLFMGVCFLSIFPMIYNIKLIYQKSIKKRQMV